MISPRAMTEKTNLSFWIEGVIIEKVFMEEVAGNQILCYSHITF